MDKTKKMILLYTGIGLIILLMLGLCFSGCSAGSGSCASSDPAQSVDMLLTSIAVGDEQTALEYIYNCSSLGLYEPENDVYASVYEELNSGRKWSITQVEHMSASLCRVTVECEHLSIDLFEEALTQRVLEEVYSLSAKGKSFDDAAYDEITYSHITQMLTELKQYYISDTVSVDLIYSNGSWRVLLTDELYSVLTGEK